MKAPCADIFRVLVHIESILSNEFDGLVIKQKLATVGRKKRLLLFDKRGIGRGEDALEVLACQAL